MRVFLPILILSLIAATLRANASEAATSLDILGDGRFSKALNAFKGSLEAAPHTDFTTPPVTVECWSLLKSKADFNLIIANEPKESGTHWELYTYIGTGVFSVFLPGYTPADIRSNMDITDGQWHYLAMVFDATSVRLFVDTNEVVNQPVTRNPMESRPGSLRIGTVEQTGQEFSCNGLIDEVRISKGTRSIHELPQTPFENDAETIALWHFDSLEQGLFPDASTNGHSLIPHPIIQISMDESDRMAFKAGPAPMDATPHVLELQPGTTYQLNGPDIICLDGTWRMAEDGDQTERLTTDWPDAIPARVPGSVHTALVEAGKIPEPPFGLNDAIARENSFKNWWFKKTFPRPKGDAPVRLVFGGVAVKSTVWLNGKELGSHEGMFGGPEYDVTDSLQDENTLIVKIHPAPYEKGDGLPNDFFRGMNVGWMRTVVFNNVYGWHYCNIPAIGIWRSVYVETSPAVRINNPFIATCDAHKGILDLAAELSATTGSFSGTLTGVIAPENFQGNSYHFTIPIESPTGSLNTRLRFTLPDPKLWWPNGLGEQNLYKIRLCFVPRGGGIADYKETTFGVRTIHMAPWPDGPRKNWYNWTFVVNDRPIFVKGTGWCTMDPLMNFSRERYDRFLTIAEKQHVQLIRAWGAGMPETNEFYDLCNRKGIMVMQEWPTAWNSHRWQPTPMLEETIRLNTLRLRNNPALVMYGAGNESDDIFHPVIDLFGKMSIELDGTRPFHRGEGAGGSIHDYNCWWGNAHLDYNLRLKAGFFGEFGIACLPVMESVLRYLPEDEKTAWPPSETGAFAHHTPVFNTKEDMKKLYQYSGYFNEPDNMEDFILGSQLAQTTAVRHTLERARTRWPECSGCLYYKLNDNYPAASWACSDWYGAPKMSHYFYENAFSPLHACVLFETVNSVSREISLPVFLLDDTDALKSRNWRVNVSAFNSHLGEIQTTSYKGKEQINRVKHLGDFHLTPQQTWSTPLLITVEVLVDDQLEDRTFYWINYEAKKGCLMNLPRTRLSMSTQGDTVTIRNQGDLPGVGINLSRPGHADTFLADENFFWLNPGEVKRVKVNDTRGLRLEAWNLEE